MKTRLSLITKKDVFTIPADELLLKLWFMATYPIQIGIAYALFGTHGAILITALLILNHRGKI